MRAYNYMYYFCYVTLFFTIYFIALTHILSVFLNDYVRTSDVLYSIYH